MTVPLWGRVGARLVAHPLRGTRLVPDDFAAADGIAGSKRDVSLVIDERQLARTVLIGGCDQSLSVLASFVTRRASEQRLTWLHAPSEKALGELAAYGARRRDAFA